MADKAVSDFVLPATGGKEFRLSAVKSRLLVLYFYPKDNTRNFVISTPSSRRRAAPWPAFHETA